MVSWMVENPKIKPLNINLMDTDGKLIGCQPELKPFNINRKNTDVKLIGWKPKD